MNLKRVITMKQINIVIFLVLILSIANTACEKEKDNVTQSEQKIEDKTGRTQDVPTDDYELYNCITDDGYFGAGCCAGVVEECPQALPCQALLDEDGDPIPMQTIQEEFGFTDDQMDNWENGGDILKPTVDFVQEHYNFYLHLYNSGVTFHPDTIISNIEG